MYKHLIAPIILVIVSIAALIFSLIAFPLFMSWVAIFCVVGAILAIIGCIFWILKVILGNKFKAGNGLKTGFLWSGLAFFVLPVLIVGCILLANSFIPHTETTADPIPSETTTVPVIPSETTASVIVPSETTTTSVGIDQPSKSWFLAEPGSMISGDIAIFDGDNNSRKISIYDSDAGTADIIIIGGNTPVYIWAEWGCHYWAVPADQDLANQIENKLADGFTTVRVFSGLTRENYTIEPETHTAA